MKARTGKSAGCSMRLRLKCLRLIRVSIGPLELGDLAKGAHRRLSADEKTMLD